GHHQMLGHQRRNRSRRRQPNRGSMMFDQSWDDDNPIALTAAVSRLAFSNRFFLSGRTDLPLVETAETFIRWPKSRLLGQNAAPFQLRLGGTPLERQCFRQSMPRLVTAQRQILPAQGH